MSKKVKKSQKMSKNVKKYQKMSNYGYIFLKKVFKKIYKNNKTMNFL